MSTLLALSSVDVASLLAILTPMVAVPMAVITFYLRALRDHQMAGRGDLTRRIEHAEVGLRRLETGLSNLRRDHVTKEDWLREGLLARRNLERLMAVVMKLEAVADTSVTGVTLSNPTPPDANTTDVPYEGTD